MYPQIQRDQQRAAAERLAHEKSRRIPTLATALKVSTSLLVAWFLMFATTQTCWREIGSLHGLQKVDLDTEAVVDALEKALGTSKSAAAIANETTSLSTQETNSDATFTPTAEERSAALHELKVALKAAVDPDSLPPYCPA